MMDRARESRRTGSGGPVSAPRRPRTTGFKDSPVHDEDDMAEEVHNSRLRERKKDSLASVVSGTSLRNKRKRQEAPAPAHNSAADEPDESSDDSDGGATEDDDDPPPPPIPRWPGKPRAKEESIGLDLPAVPRKARSAIVKRNHENPPAAILAQHSPSTTTTSAAAAKPGRRMKPNGSKPRPAKVPKASPAPISEQEVEVAEALFDLARMAPNFKSETKSDSKSDKVSASPARAASPAANPSPLSPPSSSLNNVASSHPAEAPRRKRPRIRPRSEEGGSRTIPVKTEIESSRTSSEKKAENSSKLPGGISPIATPAIETSDHLKKQENASEAKPSSVNVVTDTVTSVNAELNKRKLPSGDSRPPNFEIDLMVPPAAPLQNDMVECVPEIDRKNRVEIQGGNWLDKEIKKERDKELKEKEEPRDVKLEEIDTKKEVEQVKEERECLDLNKQGIGGSRSAKGPKIDAKPAVKPDRSVSAAVVSAASSFLNASTSSCNTTPAMANWPGGYYAPPPAAVAAAAAQAAALTATSTEDNNNASHSPIMPYLTGRQSWKNCAKHVYIARFIDLQQQVARHSLMAATLGSYGAKPYNLNISADAVYGNGVSSNAMNSSVSSGLALGALSERTPQGNKSSSYMDAVFRKHTSQQQQQQQQQQLAAPAFGFPVSQGLPSNASSAAASTAGLSSASAASSTSAGSVASMAAQAQFFQAVMQHNAFPLFPTSHFTSHNFNGAQNLGQQAQYVNNPFYASHLIHTTQQQAQANVQKPQQSAGRIFSGSYGTSEKDGTAAAVDNKMLQRLMFSQQSSSNGAPNLNAPASDPSQDYSKHVGKLQQSQPPPSQISNPALQMSLKGMESQTSQQQGNGNRGTVGPGPLGLPPVAAVMGPLMAEQGRLHQHAMQTGGQQSRSLRVAVDEMFEGSNQGNADERKLAAAKRGPSISRVDLETLPSMQGSPTSGNSSSRMGNATAMNLLPASSRLQTNVQGPPPVQQTLNQNMKQPVVRAKAPLSTSAPSPVNSLGDRTSRNTGPPPGISFPPQALKQQSQQLALQQQQQQQQHAQLKQLSQRPPSVTPAPVVNVMAKPQQIPQARSPQSSAGGAPPRVPPPGTSGPGSPSVSSMPQPPKQGSVVNAKNTNKATTFPLSTPSQKQQQQPAPVVSGKRSPANSGINSQTQQPKVMPGQPQQSTSSPQHTPAQQQQYQLSQQQVNHLQKQLPQLRQSQMFLQPQHYQHQQTLSQIPQQVQNTGANGLSLSSQMGGGSNGNGKSGAVIDGASSFSQGIVSKTPPLTRNSPSSSSSVNTITGVLPQQQQRVNGTTGMNMPVLHQTGSPSSISQHSSTYSVSYSTAVKPPEMKNEAASPVQPSKTPGYPSQQTPGTARQQQQQQQPGTPGGNSTSAKGSYGDNNSMAMPRTPPPGTSMCTGVSTSGSLSTMMTSSSAPGASFGNSTSTDGRVGFGNPTQQQQSVAVSPQQHIPPPSPQNILPSSTMSLASIAVAAASSAGPPGLLGQSSASALRP